MTIQEQVERVNTIGMVAEITELIYNGAHNE